MNILLSNAPLGAKNISGLFQRTIEYGVLRVSRNKNYPHTKRHRALVCG
jgi:hypothetical protein